MLNLEIVNTNISFICLVEEEKLLIVEVGQFVLGCFFGLGFVLFVV
jgi:hypothetical protein